MLTTSRRVDNPTTQYTLHYRSDWPRREVTTHHVALASLRVGVLSLGALLLSGLRVQHVRRLPRHSQRPRPHPQQLPHLAHR